MPWEHFSHGADIGIRGIGATREEAFEQAALALTAVITDPAGVAAIRTVHIEREAPDDELLLADWLNALIYDMAFHNLLFARTKVHLDGGRLEATAWGETVDPVRHHPTVEVKAATYMALSVARRDDKSWIAQCVVDV